MTILFEPYTGILQKNVQLSGLTSWGVGGPADYVAIPQSEDELITLLHAIRHAGLPWIILGRGCNTLFSDNGFRGVIIRLGGEFLEISFKEEHIVVGAGMSLRQLAMEAVRYSLTGLEALSGIPGTCGAAAFMNAGAYGIQFWDLIETVSYLSASGYRQTLEPGTEGYRRSSLPEGCIITRIHLRLSRGRTDDILNDMLRYRERRQSAQPLNAASAGCTFKNPPGKSAGRLIDELGLKGLKMGDAEVSPKHANFIINLGAATAQNIRDVIREVRHQVKSHTGIGLDLEVRIFDEFGMLMDTEG